MTSSMKNLFISKNLSIQNPIILNNYSIQNIIISPSNLTYEKIDYNKKHIANPKSSISSTTPIKGYLSGIIPLCYEQKNINRNKTPISKFKTQAKFDVINLDDMNYTVGQYTNQCPQILSITKIKKNKEEKHPEDSIKKNLAQTKFKDIVNQQDLFYKYKDFRVLNYMSKSGSQSLERNNHKLGPKNSSSKHKIPMNSKSKSKSIFNINAEPNGNLILKEFIFGEQIGKGTFGKIFCVNWTRNKKLYAMKKEILSDFEQVQKRVKIYEMIQNIIKKTGCKGIINLYGNLYIKKKNIKNKNNINIDNNNKDIQKNNKNNLKYIYYELMEKAERDWDKEINKRSQLNLYYTQKEIIDIMKQLIGVLSLLQKNHITHRDIKPQNILIINGKYKLSDFGEIRELKRDGLIVQRVRGSELYMSPILFHGLHLNILQVKHNTYKSDVFSLGMCLFYACSLTYSGVDSIREITSMNKIKEIVFQYLRKNYSTKLIYFILSMLEVDENKRLNFIQLEEKLKRLF